MLSSVSTQSYEWLGFSFKSILFILIGIIGLGYAVGILLFGENSLEALNHLQLEKEQLLQERTTIKSSNQKLQKEYFELLQLTE